MSIPRLRSRHTSVSQALLFIAVQVAALTTITLAPGLAHALGGTLSNATPVLNWSNPLVGGANSDESTCIEGTTCETYTLTLAPGDYTGKMISISISWLVPTDDFDLYVHADSTTGAVVLNSGNPPPGTSEGGNLSIEPPLVTVARIYYVHTVAFAAPAPGYSGTAALVAAPAPRVATYLPGSLRFSQNVRCEAPFTTSDGEPSCRVDVRGNAYVGGIRGVPAGVDVWRFDLNPLSPTFDPGMQHPTYLGQPDAFAPQPDPYDPLVGGADGGGDIDIATSFPANGTDTPRLNIVSLAAATISSAVSTDRGGSFTLSPAVSILPVDDRQWIEDDGPNTVYMLYRGASPATASGLVCARSDDGGATFPTTGVVNALGTTPGYIDVDHATGRIYAAHNNTSAGFIGYSTDQGLTWTDVTVDNSTPHHKLFDVVKVGNDGTAYYVWADGSGIYLAHSSDGGAHWSSKVRVNDTSVYRTNLFPWLEAGDAGRVDVVWYGSASAVNGDDSDWSVLFAQSLDANATSPTFRQQVISDHNIHGSNISLGGLDPTSTTENRNLLDYFQVAIDPQGAAVVAFTDDHNDYDGNTYVTRQLDGISLDAAANGSGQVTPAFPPALPSGSNPEVTDFAHDAVLGLVQPIPTDNPFDILSVDYDCEDSSGNPMLVTSMQLSGLTATPAGGNWRTSFSANAPGGVSDRGQQFYFLANSDAPASPAFTWGTTVRNSDGSITYTNRGNADFGAIDNTNGTVTIKVALSQLNAFASPPIAANSVLWGLRGRANSSGVNGTLDVTYGGFSYTVCPSSLSADPVSGTAAGTFLGRPSPNPAHGATTFAFRVERAGVTELAVFDLSGRHIRTLQSGVLAPGEYHRTWDGRNDQLTQVRSGVYMVVLRTAEGIRSQRVALLR